MIFHGGQGQTQAVGTEAHGSGGSLGGDGVDLTEEGIDQGQKTALPVCGGLEIASLTNEGLMHGALADAMVGADVFVGVSAPGVVSADMIKSMASNAIVFPMANPTPEIMPDEAIKAGARIVGTGRSDYPNQINNVLAFPGIFRGALDCRATSITERMKVATSYALAELVPEDKLSEEYIIPGALDKRVAPAVAASVIKAAREEGVARI